MNTLFLYSWQIWWSKYLASVEGANEKNNLDFSACVAMREKEKRRNNYNVPKPVSCSKTNVRSNGRTHECLVVARVPCQSDKTVPRERRRHQRKTKGVWAVADPKNAHKMRPKPLKRTFKNAPPLPTHNTHIVFLIGAREGRNKHFVAQANEAICEQVIMFDVLSISYEFSMLTNYKFKS